MLRQLHNKKLDRTNVHAVQAKFTAILKEQIELFDREIGETMQQICPKPENLTEEQARHLLEHHKEAIDCAFEGTTLALALVNVDQHFMWAAGVGDSTVGELMWRQPESSSLTDCGAAALSTIGSDGKRRAERLCDLHTFKNPKEYYRAVMAHSSYERPIVDSQDRMLGVLGVPRGKSSLTAVFPAKLMPMSNSDWGFRIETPFLVLDQPLQVHPLRPCVWALETRLEDHHASLHHCGAVRAICRPRSCVERKQHALGVHRRC